MEINSLLEKVGTHPLDRAAAIAGARSSLAVMLGVTESAIGNWKKRGVPIEQCVSIWRLTAGAVTRQDLRPDDWADIWPELATGCDCQPDHVQAVATSSQPAIEAVAKEGTV